MHKPLHLSLPASKPACTGLSMHRLPCTWHSSCVIDEGPDLLQELGPYATACAYCDTPLILPAILSNLMLGTSSKVLQPDDR